MTTMDTPAAGAIVPLTAAEAATLATCEQVIDRGLATFVEVGKALQAIRDQRLYRAGHATFEDYCRARWHLAKSHVYRMIEAAEVVAILSPMGDEINYVDPANERQVRPLAQLLPGPDATPAERAAAAEQIRDSWRDAVDHASHDAGGRSQVTARHVADAVGQRAEQPADSTSQQAPVAASRRRRPLPDAFRDAVLELAKAVERLQRLVGDDRWPATASKVTPATRELHHMRDVLVDLCQRTPATEDPIGQDLEGDPL